MKHVNTPPIELKKLSQQESNRHKREQDYYMMILEIWRRNCNGEIDIMKKKIKVTYDFVLEDKPFRREGASKEGRDRKD